MAGTGSSGCRELEVMRVGVARAEPGMLFGLAWRLPLLHPAPSFLLPTPPSSSSPVTEVHLAQFTRKDVQRQTKARWLGSRT